MLVTPRSNISVQNFMGSPRTWQLLAAIALIAAMIYLIRYSTTFFTQQNQILLGWGCLAVIYLMYKFKITRRQPWRMMFMILAIILALRYILWRIFDTMIITDTYDLLGMSLLLIAEIYAVCLFFSGLFINAWPLERTPIALPEAPHLLPTVDVFIPTYNESDDIIRITATAATQIEYPKDKFNIYLLDDGSSWAKRNHPKHGKAAWERHYRLRQLAAELGIHYLTRETNQQAKAGNINHALRHTHSEVVLVLDCDHVPTHDILKNTMGFFVADPNLFLVQTPHFFINPSPVEKNLDDIANPPGENDMFYRTMHPAMDLWNASYFCGSAALLRRTCLESVGGLCGTTITEDAETSFNLHGKGYNSVYVNRPMICGLSPESYNDYVIQRSRWAQGMTQMLLLDNPLFAKNLTLPQRIAYFTSSLFWLFGFARIIYFLAPAAFLILGMNIYNASWMQIIAFAVPFLICTFLVMDYLYSGTRQLFFSEIYESVQAMFLLPAIISVLLHPHKPSFKVTPKGNAVVQEVLSPFSAPFFIVIAINFIALVLAVYKWFEEPILREVVFITGMWCVYNFYLALVSLGAFWERKQVRKFHRIQISGMITAHFSQTNEPIVCRIRDISLTGIGFEIDRPITSNNDQVKLEVKDSYGRAYMFECKVHHVFKRGSRYIYGSEFVVDKNSYPEIVSFVFGDSQRWVENWENKSVTKGSVRMLLRFLSMGVRAIRTAAYQLLKLAVMGLARAVKVSLTTMIVRDALLNMGGWLAYRSYSILIIWAEYFYREKIRKFRRFGANSPVEVFFPRLGTTLHGQINDFSLSGIGLLLTPPFALVAEEQMVLLIGDAAKSGLEYRLGCKLAHTFMRDEQLLYKTKFDVDIFSYPKIVNLVYGSNMQLLRFLLTRKVKSAV